MVLQILMAVVFSAVVSYLLGSCNSSIIVVKLLKGEDIRKFGSFSRTYQYTKMLWQASGSVYSY